MRPVLAGGFHRSKVFTFDVQIDSETGVHIITEIWQYRIKQYVGAYVRRKEMVMRDQWRFGMHPLRLELAGTKLVEEIRAVSKPLLKLDLKLPEGRGGNR